MLRVDEILDLPAGAVSGACGGVYGILKTGARLVREVRRRIPVTSDGAAAAPARLVYASLPAALAREDLMPAAHLVLYAVFEGTRPAASFDELMRRPWARESGRLTVCVPSEYNRRALLAHGFPEVHVVPHGVDATVFHPARAPSVRRTSAGTTRFLCVGQYHPRKNVDAVIEAFGRLGIDGAELWLLCSGLPAGIELPPRAHALRPAPDDDAVARAMRSCDWLVAAAGAEGFGLPVLEAVASGIGVVAVRYGGVADVLRAVGPQADVVDIAFREGPPPPALDTVVRGEWAQVTADAVADAMRAAHARGSSETRDRAAAAARAAFDWGRIADLFADLIKAVPE